MSMFFFSFVRSTDRSEKPPAQRENEFQQLYSVHAPQEFPSMVAHSGPYYHYPDNNYYWNSAPKYYST